MENEIRIICGKCKTTVNLNRIYYDDYFEKSKFIQCQFIRPSVHYLFIFYFVSISDSYRCRYCTHGLTRPAQKI